MRSFRERSLCEECFVILSLGSAIKMSSSLQKEKNYNQEYETKMVQPTTKFEIYGEPKTLR